MRDKPRPVTTRPGWAWAAIGDTVKQLGQGRVTVSCFRALFAYLSMQWASQTQSILLVGVLHCYFGLVHFHLWILLENCNGHHRNTLSFWVCLVYFGLRILSENCNGHHRSNLSFWLVGSVILAWFILAWEFYQKIAMGITGAHFLSWHHRSNVSFRLVYFVVILAWFILCLWICIRIFFCNGITEATYPSVLGVVNFCHEITGATVFLVGVFCCYFGSVYSFLVNFYQI